MLMYIVINWMNLIDIYRFGTSNNWYVSKASECCKL